MFDQSVQQYSQNESLQEPKNQLENLTSHCRICLASTSSKMTNLFSHQHQVSNDENLTILEKLNYCSCMPTKPRANDGLPQFICMSCSVLLESAYQFKVLCSKTEEKLLSLVTDTRNVKQESKVCDTSRVVEMENDDDYMKDKYCVKELNELDHQVTEGGAEIIVRVVGDEGDYSEQDGVMETVVIETLENNDIESRYGLITHKKFFFSNTLFFLFLELLKQWEKMRLTKLRHMTRQRHHLKLPLKQNQRLAESVRPINPQPTNVIHAIVYLKMQML